MQADLVIRNGQIITADMIIEADLAVQDGRIAAIGEGLSGREIWDAQGCLVLPGGVDVHVHPQMAYGAETTADDWYAASRAAACGGTTTLMDFVEPCPGQTLLEALSQRLDLIRPQAYVDFALHMTLASSDPQTLSQIESVVEAGVTSFKMYTTYPDFCLADDNLLSAFEVIQKAGGLALIHCENDAILRWNLNRLRRLGKTAPRNYPRSRPPEAEAEAVQRVILLARQTGTPVYLVHLTTAGSLRAVEEAQSCGWPVFAETCPQYLLLDESRYHSKDPLQALGAICAPPLRTPADQAALWRGLQNGTLQSIGSDHCAFSLHRQKSRSMQDFSACPPGMPGVEARLSLIYTCGVCTGKISLNRWVELCCTNPARLLGLYPRKGSLQIGSDADIVIFNPRLTLRLTSQSGQSGYRLHEGIDYTPYENWEVNGWPTAVFLRGQPIVQYPQPVSPAALGEFITRQPLNF